MAKYMDSGGLSHLMTKIKEWVSSTFVKKSAEMLTTNPFRPSSLGGPYISKIDNAFYAADKRWAVSATLNGSAISAGNVVYWFNGDYESRYQVAKSGTCVITMDFTNTTYFPGYPYGYILVSFYYNEAPASVSGRVYCNYQSHGVGWHDISFAPVSDSGTYSTVYRSAHQGYYNISQLEITVVASSSVVAGISQIEMHLDRPYSGRNPFLSKYTAETLYYNLTAPKFIGDLEGKAYQLKDTKNGNAITASFNDAGLAQGGTQWFTAWNSYQLRAMSAVNTANTLLNALSTDSSDPQDADYYISQYVGGGTSTTTYHRRPMSALWNYVKGKISSVLGLTATQYSGNAATATNATNVTGTVAIANGGTGATTAAAAWTALGGGAIGKKASLAASDIPAHASTATTYGAASTSNYGHAKLSSATDSTSEALAATPKAVKAAYDLATTASNDASSAMSAATGALVFKITYSISNGNIVGAAHVYSAGAEVTSDHADSCFAWSYRIGTGSSVSLGTGKTKTVAVTTLELGGSLKCDFTPAS